MLLDQRSGDQYEFLPSYIELIERPPLPTARITAVTLQDLQAPEVSIRQNT